MWSVHLLRLSKVRLLHMTGIHFLRLIVTLRGRGRRVIPKRGIGGFPLRVTGVCHFPCLRVLSLALPHVELTPPLQTNFENKRRPGGAVTHQVPQCGLRLADEVILSVVVVIKDCNSDGQGEVIVTKLGQRNVDQLPTWVQIIPNCLSFSNLQIILINFLARDF